MLKTDLAFPPGRHRQWVDAAFRREPVKGFSNMVERTVEACLEAAFWDTASKSAR